MDISKVLKGSICTVLFFHASFSFAFTELTHEQITRSAFAYMKTHERLYPETENWLTRLGQNQSFMEETLIRSVVDTDFRTNMWLDAWFHAPFSGATNSVNFSMFTTLFHFLNVNQKGTAWDYDGYSYEGSSREGADNYLATPSVVIKGEYAPPLGGRQPNYDANQKEFDVGVYMMGFKGTIQDWNDLYFSKNEASGAILPPSNIPAELAYRAMMKSSTAGSSETNSWNQTFPVVDGVFTSKQVNRHYWRGQIEGLPTRFELLGMTTHLMQDLSVPHHALGIIDWCHAEFEDEVDNLACNNVAFDKKPYFLGMYEGNLLSNCQTLYDPEYVSFYLRSFSFLDPKNKMTIKQRFLALAFWSARWKWGSFGDTGDFATISTIMPSGTRYDSDTCRHLMEVKDVHDEIKRRYNVAVASSIALFELASHEYQTQHMQIQRALIPFEILNSLFKRQP